MEFGAQSGYCLAETLVVSHEALLRQIVTTILAQTGC